MFFDNLQVTHTPGPMLEETHYYPFGLTMQGISSKAAGGVENKKKFNKGSELNNKEFSDGNGLEWYATKYRMYDPQIGRWHVPDPKPSDSISLYNGFFNNPIKYNDPLGDTSRPGVQGTATITLFSIGLNLEIKGTPVTGGFSMRTNEIDLIGFRNNTFIAGGHEVNGTKTGVSRDGIGGNILGIGKEVVNESSLPKNYKSGEKKASTVTETTTTPFVSLEKTISDGRTQTQGYIGIAFKAAMIIGVEAELKIPVSGNNYSNLIPPKNGQPLDNTGKRLILPTYINTH